MLKLIVIISLVFLTNYSCSNEDSSNSSCFQDENRSIVETFKDIQGVIKQSNELCDNVYIIEPNETLESVTTGLLYPCSLSDELKINGTKITFSGHLYETFDLEDICANKFEITEYEINN